MKEMRIMRAIGGIDDAYIDEAAPVQRSKAVRFWSTANIAMTAAAAVLILGLGTFAVIKANSNIVVDVPGQTTTENTVTTTDMPMVMIGNPFEYYDTLEEAVTAVGFEMTAPESFGIYTDRHISTIDGKTIDISYRDKDGNEGLCIRKAVGTDDLSGSYYNFETVLPIQGKNGTMSGITRTDGTVKIYKAVWTDGAYAYSVIAPYDSEDESGQQKGLTQTEMEEIIKNVK